MPEVLQFRTTLKGKDDSICNRQIIYKTSMPSIATVNVQSVITDSFKKLEGIVLLHIHGPSATLSDCSGVFPGFYMLSTEHSVGGFAVSDNGLFDKRPTLAVC